MVGPCLCGDPYCSSCGDPSAAVFEEAIEILVDKMIEQDLDEKEFQLFMDAGFAAVERARKEVKDDRQKV